MKKMLLIDGNSMLFRAFYATSYGEIMKTSFGEYTNAVFTFITMLNKALKQIDPEYVVVAFDKGKKTFRHEKLESYKEGRKQTPEELVSQFALVRKMLQAYNIKYLEYDYIEADDIVGTIAKKYSQVHHFILSSDKDLLQLVDENISYLMMKKGMSDLLEITNKNIVEHFGVTAFQIPDFKGLMGDKSDNIKGVEGVGEKTALKFLSEYGNIENLYANIEQVKGKIKEKLISGKQDAFLSKEIATIKQDVEIEEELEDFVLNIDYQSLEKFLKDYEMNSLLKQINPSFKHKESHLKIEIVDKFSEQILVEGSSFFVYFDQFNYYEDNILAIAVKNNDLIEIIYKDSALFQESFKQYLCSDIKKISTNVKHLYHLSDKYNISFNNVEDLELMGFLCNNNNDDLNKLFLSFNKNAVSVQELVGTAKKIKEIDFDLLQQQIKTYLVNISEIYPFLVKKLEEDQLNKLYYELELPLSYVLYEMEKAGISVNIDVLEEISTNLNSLLINLTKQIHNLAGKDFNINSPKQLAEVLFDDLGLKTNKKRSTSIEILEFLEDQHPIISLLIEYRHYMKIYSTYSEGLKKYISKDGKIHTIYSSIVTQTGRLSSKDPNLQNLSVRSKEGKEIRKAFIASDDHILISSDYSQIELRILAHMAAEKNMIEAFKNGVDIHSKTAMDMFEISQEELNSDYRRKAKAINFGIIYGISEFGLTKQTGINMFEAKEFIDTYFKKYPNIKNFMDSSLEHLKANGYVTTLLNRRRYINEINSDSYNIREFAKRAAFNSPIQGSGADIIKLAMLNIYREITKNNLKSKLILQIHDELVFDVLKSELDIMKSIIKKGMNEAIKLQVPLETDLHVSDSLFLEK